ncbi:serine/threonine-protein kinase 3-like [Paramacrobiotus metropolitanus]|uniref:serine/threonine-protein kinase 3-like n=1 Tax=Paramacrobiotus metropolitanus TaxID=2943436 RepID=UPI0024458205|nr:serine/threonine-protein kinase 3-like [Paramacrobiotus metropolitanus]
MSRRPKPPRPQQRPVDDRTPPDAAQLPAPAIDSRAVMQFEPNGTPFEVAADDLELVRNLGRGQYGSVDEYRHRVSRHHLAVKRIRVTDDAEQRKRMLMDLEVNKLLNGLGGECPYLVRSFGSLFREGDVWICMEVMDTSLDAFYKKVFILGHTIPERVIAHIAWAALVGLSFLKCKLDIMHRDVKPSNMLLSRRGDVKLCDFGISAKLVKSHAKTAIGSPCYLPPERITPPSTEYEYDIRSDVWSYGLSLIEIALGKFPYKSWRDKFEQMKEVVGGPPPSIPDFLFSHNFRDFVRKCCEKDVDLRPTYRELQVMPFLISAEMDVQTVSEYFVAILDAPVPNDSRCVHRSRPPLAKLDQKQPQRNDDAHSPAPGIDTRATMKFEIDGPEYEVSSNDLDFVRSLGRGQYGSVDEYKHKPSGFIFAVKRIRSTDDPEERKTMLMDLNVNKLSAGKCPYVVRSFGALFSEGDLWICMEIMDKSLEMFYKKVFSLNQTIPESVIAHIAFAMISGLKFLKDELNIMHRDVKPSNILLSRRGDVKLCDFGISGQLVQSMAKTKIGCSFYLPPERVDPMATAEGGGYDIRSDVWSCGITLIEIAIGKLPYKSWKSLFQQINEVVHGPPPTLPSDSPYSQDFRDFVDACCQKDVTHRPKYDVLLEMPFLTKEKETPKDISTYVVEILDTPISNPA